MGLRYVFGIMREPYCRVQIHSNKSGDLSKYLQYFGRASYKKLDRFFHIGFEDQTLFLQVLNEGDIDDDQKLSLNEFDHVITKSPDFLSTFHFGI